MTGMVAQWTEWNKDMLPKSAGFYGRLRRHVPCGPFRCTKSRRLAGCGQRLAELDAHAHAASNRSKHDRRASARNKALIAAVSRRFLRNVKSRLIFVIRRLLKTVERCVAASCLSDGGRGGGRLPADRRRGVMRAVRAGRSAPCRRRKESLLPEGSPTVGSG